MNRTAANHNPAANDVVRSHNQRLVIFLMFFACLAVLVSGALIVSARRLLWNDELFTYYIATLPSFSEVWAALLTGQEQTPPAYYAIVRGTLAIFGNNSIALRLPSLIGFLLLAVALFKFVSFRLPPIYGIIAASFTMVTGILYYVHEARPYGLELGFAALALLCWQRATEKTDRFVALGGLWFSIAAAISCHYYGVLLILPLAMGEVIRTVCRKRIDIAIWICFAASILPFLFALRLILNAVQLSGVFWAQPHWSDAVNFFASLNLSVPPLIAALTIAIIAPRFFKSKQDGGPPAREAAFLNYEVGAILGFVSLPVWGLLLAEFITKAFVDRYVLSTVLGISLIVTDAIHKLLGGRFGIAVAIAVLLVAYFLFIDLREISSADKLQTSFERSMTLLQSADKDGQPIVISDPHTFVMFSHYAPSDVKSQLIYLASPTLAGEILGFTSVKNGMVRLIAPWFHMRVVPFEEFLTSNSRFILYGSWDLNWVTRALLDRRFKIMFLERSKIRLLIDTCSASIRRSDSETHACVAGRHRGRKSWPAGAAACAEGLTRTNIGSGPVWLTFRPLLGFSEVVKRFHLEKNPDRHITQMTIDDASHYREVEKKTIIASPEARTRSTHQRHS